MPGVTDSGTLAAKYDEVYRDCAGQEAVDVRVKPIEVRGWPTDCRQAVVYLARPGGRLLEIGCGHGEVLAALAPYFDEVVGIELSSIRAERARQGLSHLPNCVVLNESLEGLAAKATSPFDCIIWADVIEHIVDVIGAMRILARLSRVGTQLVTVTPNVAFLPHRIRLLLGRAPTTAAAYPNEGFTDNPSHTILFDAGHLHYFTFRQVEMLYRLAGFRPERRLGIASRLSRLRNWWPTLLSSSVCISGTFQGT
ncbi:MAG TPA: class I SAM-dependent methyltransferase [Thermoflexia bacterium]|jgi:SAM-dependent methyltransferase|nr:class I SAM-dependent methyltransferase [Thermoflexia bacterium]